MRRADRLFDIIQILRTAKKPLTAQQIAEDLEVTMRTVYRDIATLQARRVPIEGAAGIGYVLRRGYDLPPLMFTLEELEAIAVGVRLVRRTGDTGLRTAAASALSKVTVALPETLRQHLEAPPVFVSESGAPAPSLPDLPNQVRAAIRDARKLRIAYLDLGGHPTERTIWPLAIAYYVGAMLVCGWCELRQDFRHFRADRISAADLLDETYPAQQKLMAQWLAQQETAPH